MSPNNKEVFNQLSDQIRWVKKQKAQAYRDNRLEDARNFEKDEQQLRQLSHSLQNS